MKTLTSIGTVKTTDHKTMIKGALEAALSYAYTSVRELPPDSDAVFGIDRHGISVCLDEIVNVEFTNFHELDG